MELLPGHWRAWLDSPGGELPFGLELTREGATWGAILINGLERQKIEHVRVEAGRLWLSIEHYDAHVEAVYETPSSLEGRWWKTGKHGTVSELPFHAAHGQSHRFAPLDAGDETEDISGRWSVQFVDDDDPSVAVFERGEGNEILATFLNTTGDFRFIAGSFEAGRLRLSVFDGAHAFLFDARLEENGNLRGDFWSRDTFHDTWVAIRDDSATIPPGTGQVAWVGDVALAEIAYPDLEGTLRSLDDPEFDGKARILEVFGSWCPNCNDATEYLVELHARYRDRGLSVVGLAFEMTGDFERDADQVRTYRDYHGIEFPLLIAGTADKAEASEAFPLIDRVKSFPTTIFLHGDGRVHTVHSGYSGPATGDAHEALKAQFESIVEELLGDGD